MVSREREELKKYLTNHQEAVSNQTSEESIQAKKDFLKKGVSSRKYDPKLAIVKERETKKQKEEQKVKHEE